MTQHLPIRVAVLCSGSASSFRYLYENDPKYGVLYKFVGVFSDVPDCKGIMYARDRGIPTASLDFKTWRKEHGVAFTDLERRKEYFSKAAELIVWPWKPEALMLSGFMLRLTEPFFFHFAGRMLNVHPARLSIQNEWGGRKYTGLDVVRRAIEAGDPTGSTVHIVTEEPDMGPIIVETKPLPYEPGVDPAEHQERMKTACDGPAYKMAFETLIEQDWPAKPWR